REGGIATRPSQGVDRSWSLPAGTAPRGECGQPFAEVAAHQVHSLSQLAAANLPAGGVLSPGGVPRVGEKPAGCLLWVWFAVSVREAVTRCRIRGRVEQRPRYCNRREGKTNEKALIPGPAEGVCFSSPFAPGGGGESDRAALPPRYKPEASARSETHPSLT